MEIDNSLLLNISTIGMYGSGIGALLYVVHYLHKQHNLIKTFLLGFLIGIPAAILATFIFYTAFKIIAVMLYVLGFTK
jgi:hypothetical protein